MIARLGDWRGETLARIRKAVLAADPDMVEEWKWIGSAVWSRDGLIAFASEYERKVKLTFVHGARLPDPKKLFNVALEGAARGEIEFFEGGAVDEPALTALVGSAIEFNRTRSNRRRKERD